MEKNNFNELLKCIGRRTKEALPEIIKLVPVLGKPLEIAARVLEQGYADYKNQKISNTELQQVETKFNDIVKEEALKIKPPIYMDCAIFRCKMGSFMSDEQQELLANVFEHEIEDDTGMIDSFFDDYMIADPQRDDDYYVGEDYVSLNFSDYNNFPYDRDSLCRLQQGLNAFLGADLFDYFVAFGHDEPNYEA